MAQLPSIKPGQRALIAGRTGSGKSSLGKWLLLRSPGKWVILNPKHTAAYSTLPDSVKVSGMDWKKIDKFLSDRDTRFIIVNPHSRECNPDTLDAFVMKLHEDWRSVGLCCDELYTLHKSGVAGQGLIGWLTRGREIKQSFMGLTQRPAWLSQFLFSESDYIGAMRLSLAKDRKRMVEMTDNPQLGAQIPMHHWLWYDTVKEETDYFGPVPLQG